MLHVVFQHDETVNAIPVLSLASRISLLLLQRYESFMNTTASIACGSNITSIKELTWNGWKERLLVERLSRKAKAVLQLLDGSNRHWEETFWWMLARAVGGKVNDDAFETIAKSIPVNLLAKHKTSLHQLEALLLGQAALLEDVFDDEYPKLLQREHRFLKGKYNLQPAIIKVQFLRMRPVAFPTVRLAQLAALLQQSTHLFSKILEAETLEEITAMFNVTANDFWHYHYTLKQPATFRKKILGKDAISNIIINTVAPVLFAYGLYHNTDGPKDKALRWLEEVDAEINVITKEFAALGVQAKTAYDSQALIELKNEYCLEKRCLECSVGNFVLREAAADYKSRSGQQ